MSFTESDLYVCECVVRVFVYVWLVIFPLFLTQSVEFWKLLAAY